MITPKQLAEKAKVGQVYREYRDGIKTRFFIHVLTSNSHPEGMTFWRAISEKEYTPNIGWSYQMGFGAILNMKLELVFPKKKYPQRKGLTFN